MGTYAHPAHWMIVGEGAPANTVPNSLMQVSYCGGQRGAGEVERESEVSVWGTGSDGEGDRDERG